MSNPQVPSLTPPLRQIRTLAIVIAIISAFALLAFGVSGASAASWSNPKEIPGTNLAADEIATALEPDGSQWVVWKDCSACDRAYQIWYSKRSANGNWLSANVMGKTSTSSARPDIAISANNTKLSVWEQSGGIHRIGYVQFTSSPGGPSVLPGNGTADYYPVVAFASDGTRHIVFSRGGTVYHAQSSNGSSWQFDRVSPSSDQFYWPSVAIDNSTGMINVAYASAGRSIYFTQRSLSGGNWKNSKLLGTGKDPNIAARDGVVAVSWTDGGSSHTPQVRFLKSGAWSNAQPASQLSGAYHTHIILDSVGNAHIIWMQYTGCDTCYDIYYSDFANGRWASAKAIKASPGFNEGNDLAIDSSDGLHAVYLQYDNGKKDAWSSDRAGNGSPGPTDTPGPSATNTPIQPGTVLYNDNDNSIDYSSNWLYVNDDTHPVRNDYHTTNTSGETATFSFFGTAIQFMYITSTNYGKASVSIDGNQVDTIDMYSGSLTYKVSTTYSGLGATNHTIVIKNTGKKNASSSDTYIVLDAFYVTVPAVTNTPTNTATITGTATNTLTPTKTNTKIPGTNTPTFTPTNTLTPTNTPVNTATPASKSKFDDKSKLITYGKPKDWDVISGSPSCLYKGTYHTASADPKHTISLTFTGTQIKYWFVSNSSGGRVQVYIDDQLQGTANLHGSTDCALWKSPILARGQHTLLLKPKAGTGKINVDVIVAQP